MRTHSLSELTLDLGGIRIQLLDEYFLLDSSKFAPIAHWNEFYFIVPIFIEVDLHIQVEVGVDWRIIMT